MISFNQDHCTGCGVCAAVCPQGVIKLEKGKAQLTDYTSCMECAACRLNCEFDAITVTKGTGCLVAIIKEDILKIRSKNTGCGCSDVGDQDGCC